MKIKSIIVSFVQAMLMLSLGLFGGIAGAGIQNEFNLYDLILYQSETGIPGLDSTEVEDIISDCNKNITNNRIDNKLKCVLSHVNHFYVYQRRADNQSITFQQLMQDGGDCGNWAVFWEYIGKEFGYEINPIRVSVNSTVAHRFSIIANYQGYCKVDQRDIDCFIYA